MAHDLDPTFQAEVAKRQLNPFFGLHIDLPDPVYAVTGNASIRFNDQDWTAIGGLATIDVISEGTDGSASGIVATLNQIPSEFRPDIEEQAVRGCLGEYFIGVLDENFLNVLAFKRLARGTLQGYDITDAGTTISVKVTIETKAINQRRPAIKRFTNEYQQRKHPGDRFFEYAAKMSEVPILWANASQDATTTGGGGGGGSLRNQNVQLV